MTMPKKYDPSEIEPKWQEKWREWNIFKFNPRTDKKVFSIDTPPRYASGYLHMGHAKNYLEFEIIARAMRLLGYNVFFPVGYDDNGLPTEKYVEDELGVKREEVGREKFIQKCKEASDDLEAKMTEIYTRIGMSWDWSTLYRTIGDWSVETAQRSFLDLYEKGEVYQDKEPILWCPRHKTSLAQATVEDIERNTKLNYLYFELEDGDRIEIATTRPELLPSTVAVFVHPDDERYEDLVGKKAKVPLFNYKVPIMEAEEVDPDFGSGIVMVCTFGDNTDVEMWKKYNLSLKISITKEGKMNEKAGKYEGMSVEEAQEEIIKDLKEEGILFDQEDLHQTVGACWRCETPVEFIPTKQWFVETLEHKEDLLEQGKKINWRPEYYEERYRDWVKNLKWDWCISRQRAYGVPFPVWYCKECGNVVVADEEDLPVDPRYENPGYECEECGSEDLEPEEDVMDTWMTSSLTPQITTRWKRDEEFFEEMFPMTLRPQAHDIIRTWAFYTILKSYLHHRTIPWKDLMVSGYVYAEKGVGMSASKGTGVSPEDIIQNEGADCLRYWTASATTGEDIIYDEKDVVRGRKVLTKIWNASRFVGMHLDDYDGGDPKLEPIDKWVLTELEEVLEECEEHYRNYEVSKVRRKMEGFFKKVFCDNYLEMVKHRLYNPEEHGEESKQTALKTLYTGLLSCIKVFMPIIPHLTEEIYQNLFRESEDVKSINQAQWPEIEGEVISEEARELGEIAKDLVEEVRRWKSEQGIPLNEEISLVQIDTDSETKEKIEKMKDMIKGTINIDKVTYPRTVDSGAGIKVQNQSIEIKKIETA